MRRTALALFAVLAVAPLASAQCPGGKCPYTRPAQAHSIAPVAAQYVAPSRAVAPAQYVAPACTSCRAVAPPCSSPARKGFRPFKAVGRLAFGR